jgi:predicted metal-binding protein
MDIKNLVTFKKLKIKKETIQLTDKTDLWCQLPYPNHKKGCPNYNKKKTCPPNVPHFKKIINNYRHFYLIYSIFNFKKYKELREIENPEFFNTPARLKCVLYWQGAVRKILKEYVKKILVDDNITNFYLLSCGSGFDDKYLGKFQNPLYSMEAAGINVFKTLKNNNIEYELKPVNKIILTSLLCLKVENKRWEAESLF